MLRRDLLKYSALLCTTSMPPSVASVHASSRPSVFFGGPEGMVPLNAANLCPALQPVFNAQMEYARALNEDVSLVHRSGFVKDRVVYAREKVAEMLGVSEAESIAFVRNTSEANSIVINGISLRQQEEVLAWSENHPTNRHTWLYKQRRQPFVYTEVQVPRDAGSIDEIVEIFVRKLSKRTRVVTFSHISNISGTRIPAKELCQAIRNFKRDIHIHVDGAQSWGSVDVNLEEIDCDSFSSSSHKYFLGPRGTGILYVKQSRVEDIIPATLGYDFLLEYPLEELPDHAGRFECLGQRDTAAYAAIGDTVDVRNSLGGDAAIESQIKKLSEHALDGLAEAGVKLKTNRRSELIHGVVIADLGGPVGAYGAFLALHNANIAAAFVNGDKVCCEPRISAINKDLPAYVRLSPHIYNTEEDVDRAVAIIKRVNESKFEIVKEVVRFL